MFQLIWVQGGQKFVLSVLGDMHDALLVAFGRMLVFQSVDGIKDQRVPRSSQASRVGG